MAEFPDGEVTLLFTDIEGSTRLLKQMGESYPQVLSEHRRLLSAAFLAHGGHVVDSQGDSFLIAFEDARQAVAAATAAQRALHEHHWVQNCLVRVRMGVHSGRPTRTQDGYVGMDVHHGARLMGAGYGGQVLVSETTFCLLGENLPTGVEWRPLGRHHLKDMAEPEHIYQLVIPGVPADFPPLRTVDLRPNNLPASPTALIGRSKELDDGYRLLRRPDVRLLTLTGTGGTGKTCLSQQLARGLLGDFEDGVFFVALAPVGAGAFVVSAIAQTLQVPESGDQTLLESLKAYLQSRRMLLVLDNFEHLIEEALLVAELLSACPHLKCLVTSRMALNLRGEWVMPVSPLGLPNLKQLPPPDLLAEVASVELFVQRAQAIQMNFALDGDNSVSVAGLCIHLDGLPLAIELTVPRIRTLSPQVLLSQMERRFPLLQEGARDLPERHRTLEQCIAWSYDLLTSSEQGLFLRLGVFAGGWNLDAAEAISGGSGALGIGVLDDLSSLTAQSLVRCRQQANGEMRYSILATIREYSLDQLFQSGQTAQIRDSHLAFYLEMAEKANAEWGTARQEIWLQYLEAEHDNLREALRWALENRAEEALRLVGALGRFWEVRGHFIEGRTWLTQTLEKTDERANPWRARALCVAGKLAFLQGDFGAAWSLLESGLAASRAIADQTNIAPVLLCMGIVASYQGNLAEAERLLEESLALHRDRGDQQGEALAVAHLGIVNFCLCDFDVANGHLEESIQLSRELDDKSTLAFASFFRGESDYSREEWARATPFLEQSLELSREIDQTLTSAYSLLRLARIAACQRDDYTTAYALMKESTLLVLQLGNKWCLAFTLEAYGYLATSQGMPARATRILAAAQMVREMVGAPMPPCYRPLNERSLETTYEQLGEEKFAAAWKQGNGWQLEEAVAYAMKVESYTDEWTGQSHQK